MSSMLILMELRQSGKRSISALGNRQIRSTMTYRFDGEISASAAKNWRGEMKPILDLIIQCEYGRKSGWFF